MFKQYPRGLSIAQIEDIKQEVVSSTLWREDLRVVSRLVDSLVQTFKVPDGIYVEAKKQFSDEELIDITQLIGVYTAVAMMVGLIRPELDRYRRSSSFTTGAA
jgi:hypothetical protein